MGPYKSAADATCICNNPEDSCDLFSHGAVAADIWSMVLSLGGIMGHALQYIMNTYKSWCQWCKVIIKKNLAGNTSYHFVGGLMDRKEQQML